MSERSELRLARMQMRHQRGLPRWAWFLVFGFPALFTLIGVGATIEALIFVADAERTQGKVVHVERSYSDDGVSYTPLISYRHRDGRTYEGGTHMSSSGYNYRVGTRVGILYAPDDPDTVRINSFFSLYGLGLIFGVVGGIFLSVLLLVRRKMFGAPARGSLLERAAGRRSRTTGENAKAKTTDPSVYGHEHKPKPKHQPTVRRMR